MIGDLFFPRYGLRSPTTCSFLQKEKAGNLRMF